MNLFYIGYIMSIINIERYESLKVRNADGRLTWNYCIYGNRAKDTL